MCGGRASADEREASEYEVKAAYLYKLLLFIEWPEIEGIPSLAPGAPGTITIGIVGKDVFGAHFAKVEGKFIKTKNKKLVVKRFGSFHGGLDVTACQLLFIASSEEKNLAKILSRVNGKPLLTVSEMSGFLEMGGMVNLTKEKGRIRFEINRTPASVSGLRPSSHLLRNASRVVEIPKLPE